ncbi:uncharacterized protein LOC143308125 [Osmia lignaria lignaria]|uniref:uncharacterized protein LOC143308125 n=1 Tax=Osmia lignaria lignaria TaxID=1437193 RepID=UPI00402B5D5B
MDFGKQIKIEKGNKEKPMHPEKQQNKVEEATHQLQQLQLQQQPLLLQLQQRIKDLEMQYGKQLQHTPYQPQPQPQPQPQHTSISSIERLRFRQLRRKFNRLRRQTMPSRSRGRGGRRGGTIINNYY